MRVFLIILRVCVLLLGLGAVGLDGTITYILWDRSISKKADYQEVLKLMKALETLSKTSVLGPLIKSELATKEKDIQKELQREHAKFRMFPFLVAGAVLGLLASMLALFGRTTSAAVLFFLAAVGPTAIEPITGIAMIPFGLAGMLSLFVSFLAWVTRPKAAPADRGLDEDEDRGLDEDEEPSRGRTAAKRKSNLDEDEEPVDSIRTPSKRKGDADEDEELAEPPKLDKKRKATFEEDEAPPPRAKRKRE